MKNTTCLFKLASVSSLPLAPPPAPPPANQSAVHVTSVLCDDLIPGVGWRQIQDGWNHDQRAEIYTTVNKVPAVRRKHRVDDGQGKCGQTHNLTVGRIKHGGWNRVVVMRSFFPFSSWRNSKGAVKHTVMLPCQAGFHTTSSGGTGNYSLPTNTHSFSVCTDCVFIPGLTAVAESIETDWNAQLSPFFMWFNGHILAVTPAAI